MIVGFMFLSSLIVFLSIVTIYFQNKSSQAATSHAGISQLQGYTLNMFQVDNMFFDIETINDHYFSTRESSLLQNHDSLYRQIRSKVERLIATSNTLHPELSASLRLIQRDLLTYEFKFRKLENLVFRKGFKDAGLEGQMRTYAHRIEQEEIVSQIALLTLRRHEKDFLLRHDEQYLHEFNGKAESLRRQLVQRGVSDSSLFYLNAYRTLFNQLAGIQQQIGASGTTGLRGDLNAISFQISRQFLSLSNFSELLAKESQQNGQAIVTLVLACSIIFSILSGIWISRKLSEPIARLSRILHKHSNGVKVRRKLLKFPNAAEEVGVMTSSFVQLMEQTEMQMKEIKLKTKLLRNRNKELKKLNRELDNFLYSTAHDLRSPLASLLGLLNLIKFENQDERLAPHFEMMRSSIHRMEYFISQIVGYSKNKRLDVQLTRVDVRQLIYDTFDHHRYMEGAFKIRKHISINHHAEVFSDEGRLMTIFNNLVSNSIKYADHEKPQPWIRVTVNVQEESIDIVFSDNGVGIEPHHLDKIFQMFYRANLKSTGSGLGLFIFRENIRKLQGHVDVESVFGEGTTFHISIPNHVTSIQQNPGSISLPSIVSS